MKWSPRDWRQFTATILLALGNIPLTGSLLYAQWCVHVNAENTKAFWLGVAGAILIGLNFFGLSIILGRRTFRLKGAFGEIDASGGAADKALDAVEEATQ